MNEGIAVKELVSKEQWDARIASRHAPAPLPASPRRRGLRSVWDKARARIGAAPSEPYAVAVFYAHLNRFLPRCDEWSILEVGCAPGKHLVRFHSQFGYRPYGIDYRSLGVEETRRTFAVHGLPAENVIEADVFEDGFQHRYRERFDVVFSWSLIEHFDDPRRLIAAQTALLRPGGFLVCAAPNLVGWSYPWIRLLAPEHLTWHNCTIMRGRPYAALFDGAGLIPCFCGCVGMFQLFGASHGHRRGWRGAAWRALDRACDLADHLMFLSLRGRALETRYSPWLVYIGQKSASKGGDS